jgi:AcrR family transcriptional regulator
MSGGEARRTSKRPQLDREVIISTALDLAATGSAVTFRALGTALGTDPTAVYRHFRDKGELMQALVDRLIVTASAGLDRDASWRDQLYDGAVATIDTFAAHPRIGAEASAIATGGPGELAAINWILTQLERAGVDRREAVRYYAAYSSYVLAAASTLSWQRLHEDEVTDRWVGDLRAVDVARLPALAAVLPELVALSDRDVFLTGIDVFLESVEASARGTTADPTH